MKLFTMGFTQKTAEQYFNLIKEHHIDLLIDIRLNNKTQLAGFTKGDDLAYFLSQICDCQYLHCLEFAPTKEILDDYKGKKITWAEYEEMYNKLLSERDVCASFAEKYGNYHNIALLCSEPTAEKCHRRLLAESLSKENPEIAVSHI